MFSAATYQYAIDIQDPHIQFNFIKLINSMLF